MTRCWSLRSVKPSDDGDGVTVLSLVRYRQMVKIARFFIYFIGNNVPDPADGDSIEISPQYLVRKTEKMSLVAGAEQSDDTFRRTDRQTVRDAHII